MKSESSMEGLRGYGIALLAVVVSFLASYVSWPFSRASPWAFFFAAVIVTAWFAGQKPSVVATAILALLGRYFFLWPVHSFSPRGESVVVEVAFIGVSLFIGYLMASRRRAQAYEGAENRRFQATVSSIGDGVIATDEAGRVTFLNGVAEQLTGWNLPEAKGRRLVDIFVIVNEATRATTPNPATKVMETGRVQGLANHTILIARDGSERPIEDSAAPIMDDGRVTGVVLIFRDVTRRKRAEAEMLRLREMEREAHGRALRILESISDAFFSLDRDWNFTYLNPQAEQALGLQRGEVLGRNLWEAYPGLAESEFEREYRRVAEEGVARSFTSHYPDHDRWYEVHAYPAPDGLAVYFRDVSERMRAEGERERLAAESERQRRIYHTALSNTPDLVYVFDLNHRFIYANEALLRMWGKTWEGSIGKDCYELGYEPWHAEMHGREIDRVAATGRPIRGDVPFAGMNGRRILDYIFVPVFGADGSVEAVAGTTRDVTDRIEAEETLRSRTERLKLLVENTTDYAVILTDPEGSITEWQGGAERITGYDAREVIGEKTSLLFTPEDRAAGRPEREMSKAAEAGRAEDKRWHLRKDGSRFFADGVTSALRDEGGKLRGYGKVFKDATGERQAEEETKQRAVQLQKLAGISIRVSAAHDLPSILGVVTEEARGLIEAHQAAISFWVDQDWAQAITRDSFSEEFEAWRSSGRKPDAPDIGPLVRRMNRPIRLTREELEGHPAWADSGRDEASRPPMRGCLAAPLVGRDGKTMGVIQLSDKIEGEFTADDEAILVQLSQLTAVAIQNARLYQELRSNDERKDEFLAMLAHELRNPLAAINNAVRLTSKGDGGRHIDWSMGVVTRQMLHLSRLIDDLMDVSRITRGKITLRRDVVDATPILESAAATVGALVEQRGHTLATDIDRAGLWLKVDPTRLEQVVVNLLNNAAKYSEDGGHITLAARNEADDVVISVKDTGVGIAPDKLPEMFELFAQGDRSLARSEGGLGIGLTVVRKLVELHGGTVTAQSEGLGRGSEFTIRLPATAERAEKKPSPATPAGVEGRRARILVVDDNVDTARGMARLLKLQGHDIRTAHSGPDALEAAREHRPEFVLLDIGLPGMDGYEVASRLRREDFGKGVMIVAVSGYGQEEDRRRSREAGFDHHLIKPVDPDALMALLFDGQDDRG